MTTRARIDRGRRGERIAAEHLARAGYSILDRNFRTRYGELDLVAAGGDALVFCEVKTQVAGNLAGPPSPLDAIGQAKRRQVRAMARQWLSLQPGGGWPRPGALRFDAIGVTLTPRGEVMALEHVENAW
jgi:putative endonuclease